MLYVIAFFVPPAALLLVRKPLQAAVAFVFYVLTWLGVIAVLVPGLILYFFPIFILWFSAVWFAPVTYTFAVIKARKAGKPAPERVDYEFALRRLALTLLLMVVGPVTGRVLFWFYAAHELRERLDVWARMPDYRVRWDGAAIDGFPFVARARLTNVTLGGTEPLPYEVSAPLVVIETSAWIGPDLRVTMEEGGMLALPTLPLTLDAEAIDADFSERYALTDFVLRHVRGGEALGGVRIDAVDGQMQTPGAWMANAREDFLELNLNVSKLSLPRALPPLGDTIEYAQIVAEFDGAWPRGSLRDALASWRDGGGHIDRLSGELDWDALQVTAYEGTLRLDQALQPVGSFMATASNATAAIDAMLAAGGLSAQEAEAAKSTLASLTRPVDGAPRLFQRVSIENNRLRLGQPEILTLPRVTWP